MNGEFAYRGVSFEVTHAESVDLYHGRAKALYVALPISVSASTMYDLLRGIKAAVDDYKTGSHERPEDEVEHFYSGMDESSAVIVLSEADLCPAAARDVNEYRAAASA